MLLQLSVLSGDWVRGIITGTLDIATTLNAVCRRNLEADLLFSVPVLHLPLQPGHGRA